MKIMIHSNAPWVTSGYGRQTALMIRQFTALGHEVAVSAFHGLSGGPIEWDGVPVYPQGRLPFGGDVLAAHATHWGAELVVTLMDTAQLGPFAEVIGEWKTTTGVKLASWTPVDCTPMSWLDKRTLEVTGALPIAMSEHGQQVMLEAGLQPWHVPHAVDAAVYRRLSDEQRAATRAELGLDVDQFVVGLVAMNKDRYRKAFPEQFQGFREHLDGHPNSVLLVHSIPIEVTNLNLFELANDLGIGHAVKFSPIYEQHCGLFPDEQMTRWYNALDVLTNCSYGEGFGLPMLEAMACGVPSIGTNVSAMVELATHKVSGERHWNPYHRAWGVRPFASEIAAWFDHYALNPPALDVRDQLCELAGQYDVERVRDQYWKPLLDHIGSL